MGTRVLMLGIMLSSLISCCRADPALWFEQEPGQLIQYISPCLINLCTVEPEFNLSAYHRYKFLFFAVFGPLKSATLLAVVMDFQLCTTTAAAQKLSAASC